MQEMLFTQAEHIVFIYLGIYMHVCVCMQQQLTQNEGVNWKERKRVGLYGGVWTGER